MEQTFTDGGGLGVTVTAAAGDDGSTDGVDDGTAARRLPASAPHALACGGTALQATGGQITRETVWNDAGDGATGGGVSTEFALPAYQSGAGVPATSTPRQPGGGSPTWPATPTPQTGYTIRVDGSDQTIGGTSAVAPLWAALIALLNESLGAPLGVRTAAAVRLRAARRISRHRQRRQRRLLSPGRVGCLHRPRVAERVGAAAGAVRLRSPAGRSRRRARRRRATSRRRRPR